jgi:glutathione S-transferase
MQPDITQPDITLWHCKDARSFRVLWALEELGLPYRLHTLPFPPRWREPAYLETNPLGTIPFLTDGPTSMTESAAITHYLASRYGAHSGLNVEPHEPDYGAFLNFLHQGEATLTFPQTLVFRYNHLEKPENRQPKVAEDYKRWFLARTTWAEHTLADGRDWLCANRFTAADISVAYALQFAETLGHLPEVSPNLRTFWTRCQTRPAFHRAKAAQSA